MIAERELFEPAEYLGQERPGHFALCTDGERWRQQMYPLTDMATVVNGVNPRIDTYISQASFKSRSRVVSNLLDIGLLFTDLDTYAVPSIQNRPVEERVKLVTLFCNTEDIPTPSIILFSGRGLQLKWLLTTPLKQNDLMDWNRAQRALTRIFERFNADPKARDAARVLRLERTVNTKSGEVARVVHVTGGSEKCPARYDFEELTETLLEYSPEAPTENPTQIRVPKSRILNAGGLFQLRRLNWTRMNDIRKLWEIRGGCVHGMREITLFWEVNFLLLAEPGRHRDMWNECQFLRKEIDAGDDFAKPVDLSTIYRKAKSHHAGETIEFHGEKVPPLYTPRNQTLINIFRIAPEEERFMLTVISADEKRRRNKERMVNWRQAQGMKPQSKSTEKQKPWEKMGISRAWWYRMKSAGRE